MLLLDVAVQGVHIGNQHVIYQLDPTARNRITSAYVTCYFIGGAIGSSLGTAAYAYSGWHGVVVGGAELAVAALRRWVSACGRHGRRRRWRRCRSGDRMRGGAQLGQQVQGQRQLVAHQPPLGFVDTVLVFQRIGHALLGRFIGWR